MIIRFFFHDYAVNTIDDTWSNLVGFDWSVDRVLYKEDDLCVTTGLSLNGLLFISPRKHLDALVRT